MARTPTPEPVWDLRPEESIPALSPSQPKKTRLAHATVGQPASLALLRPAAALARGKAPPRDSQSELTPLLPRSEGARCAHAVARRRGRGARSEPGAPFPSKNALLAAAFVTQCSSSEDATRRSHTPSGAAILHMAQRHNTQHERVARTKGRRRQLATVEAVGGRKGFHLWRRHGGGGARAEAAARATRSGPREGRRVGGAEEGRRGETAAPARQVSTATKSKKKRKTKAHFLCAPRGCCVPPHFLPRPLATS